MEWGCMRLNTGHGLPNNAYQAPAVVKIGVTLLFSGSFSPAGAAIFLNPHRDSGGTGRQASFNAK